MIILCISYREWGKKIFQNISSAKEFENDTIVTIVTKKLNENYINALNPGVILFCGWSWLISPKITNNHLCIGLHPSPLPKYKGGSPIQNQIQNGEKVSAVSLFEITEKLDAGDVLFQEEISLDGFIDDIFKRIIAVGTIGIISVLQKIKSGRCFTRIKQDKGKIYKRLQNNSEITIEDLQTMSAIELYNKIRMLSGFYPNAYIVCKDNVKLYIEKVRLV